MMTDPIADMLTRIRNAQGASMQSVRVPASSVKRAVLKVLEDEGYISGVSEASEGARHWLEVTLRYHEGKPAIRRIQRVSRPGLRNYSGRGELPRVDGGLGVAIVSTSQGVMTDRAARKAHVGGEVLCVVS